MVGFLDDVLPILERAAPIIAGAIGTPFAGIAVGFLEAALGLQPGAGPKPVAAALGSATLDQLAAVKQANNDFAVAMRKLQITALKQDNDDRASARVREINVKDYTPTVLSYLLTAGLFTIFTGALIFGIPKGVEQPLEITLGSLTAAWIAMMSYYFGSSRGSQNKDQLLFDSVPAKSAVVKTAPASRPAAANDSIMPHLAGKPTAAPNPPAPASPTLSTIPGLADALHAVAPQADHARWIPVLQSAFTHWGFTKPEQVAAAVGQFTVETDFHSLIESLDFTTPERLQNVYPHAFATVDAARPYCNAPEKLANFVYAGQPGNEADGDGWRYRGRGLIQLTGKTEYLDFARAMNTSLDEVVDWCATDQGAAMSGVWYLKDKNCFDKVSNGLTDAAIDDVSKAVNGKYCKTLAKRQQATYAAYNAMVPMATAA